MPQHTPGPWSISAPVRAVGDEANDFAIAALVDETRSVIAEAFWRVGTTRFAPAEANARLIAQAPAMLEMLKELLADHANIVECLEDNLMDETCEKARAILRAAEGEK